MTLPAKQKFFALLLAGAVGLCGAQACAKTTGSTTSVSATAGPYDTVDVVVSASFSVDCDTGRDDGTTSASVGDQSGGDYGDGGYGYYSFGPFGPGTYSVAGYYSGFDAEACAVDGSSADATITLPGPQASSVIITSPSTPVREGQMLPITLTVTGANSYIEGPNPTGEVVLFYQNKIVATLTLSPLNTNDQNGEPISSAATITLPTAGITPGTYELGVAYNGDSNLTYSGGGSYITIAPTVEPTTTSLAVSPAILTAGASITLTATVKPNVAGTTPTGKVTFMDGMTSVGTATLNASGVGTLTLSTAYVPIGVYSVAARYGGDKYNAASTSAAQKVTIQAATNATVAANPSTVSEGNPVTLTVAVAREGTTGAPAGTVDFMFDGYTFGSGTLNTKGQASLTFSTANLSVGSYDITAGYNGDTLDAASASPAVTITVQ